MPAPAPYLSVVTPVHNGAAFIQQTIAAMLRAFERLQRPFELIVVCDGSTDGTAEQALAVGDPRVRILQYEENRGKGVAVTCGLAHARGRLVGWLDADLDIAPDLIVAAARRFEQAPDVDAIVGSKRHPQSVVSYPLTRRIYSWGFQLLVRLLFRVNVRDTQVGAKLFRREMLDTVVPLLLIKRYAYDLELLAVGAEFGFERVEEIPIRLDYQVLGQRHHQCGSAKDARRHARDRLQDPHPALVRAPLRRGSARAHGRRRPQPGDRGGSHRRSA